jgi:hypothetical protein
MPKRTCGNCVNCDRELKYAPTKLGWVECGEHGKICFECLEKLNQIMTVVKDDANPRKRKGQS